MVPIASIATASSALNSIRSLPVIGNAMGLVKDVANNSVGEVMKLLRSEVGALGPRVANAAVNNVATAQAKLIQRMWRDMFPDGMKSPLRPSAQPDGARQFKGQVWQDEAGTGRQGRSNTHPAESSNPFIRMMYAWGVAWAEFHSGKFQNIFLDYLQETVSDINSMLA